MADSKTPDNEIDHDGDPSAKVVSQKDLDARRAEALNLAKKYVCIAVGSVWLYVHVASRL